MLKRLHLSHGRQHTPQPDINEPQRTRVFPRRINKQPRLVRPKGHGQIGPHGSPEHLPTVRLNPTGQIDGDDGTGPVLRKSGKPSGIGPKPPLATNPDNPVNNKVSTANERLSALGGYGRPPGPPQRREPP
ncbi:hypothetical protein OK074_8361 [Actinobacteria bacterium OK074]|nr:hypothetical protein OK074_8361 [Actinobacteria bacterium OK074]